MSNIKYVPDGTYVFNQSRVDIEDNYIYLYSENHGPYALIDSANRTKNGWRIGYMIVNSSSRSHTEIRIFKEKN